jgi:malonate transporter and related proteins
VNTAQLLIPDFLLIACGALICRYTALNQSVWEKVEQLVYWFLFPVLLFSSVLRSPLDLRVASKLGLAAICTGAVMVLLACSLRHWPGLRSRIDVREHAASAQVAFRFNSFVALAVAERMAGAEGLLTLALIIGCCVPMFNASAVWPMAKQSGQSVLGEMARNPLILSTAGGLICNLAGLSMPDWLATSANRIGGCAIVLGLLAAGAAMRFDKLWAARTLGVSVLVLRHAVTPFVALGFALLFGLGTVQASVLLVFACVPTASSCHVLANRMGYDGGLVAGLVTLSTVLALASLPLGIWLGALAAQVR